MASGNTGTGVGCDDREDSFDVGVDDSDGFAVVSRHSFVTAGVDGRDGGTMIFD